ncbi:MAG: hypothetical protein KME65_13260 [Candidatus Thiodiazotropha sp. (ex Ctena orbiculata)]|uniref:Uncharacterized protein n=1 Tax=Candidatus Thiodiazotropha taylori TaxID=2792791 RepID=A0A944M9P9_9GAMM|nr:hypothetical protein [Candidatus Thiodiazotropha taylori]
MTTERQSEQAIPSDDTDELEVVAQPTSSRVAYKSILTAVVIGIVTISGLWLLVLGQEGDITPATLVPEASVQAQESSESADTTTDRNEGDYDRLDQRLTLLSGRIDRGFETQHSHSVEVKQSLTSMAESVKAVKAAVTELTESNKALRQRIDEAVSRLDALIKEARKRKVVQHKPAAKPKPRPAKTPPFQVDAIDVWDDANYVAVSQAGRAAFLKEGEQRSGWTVARIDRMKGQVEFRGPTGQIHSVSIQR